MSVSVPLPRLRVATCLLLRPAELATDDAKTIDVVLDVIDRIQGFDLVVVLQPTSPLREHPTSTNVLSYWWIAELKQPCQYPSGRTSVSRLFPRRRFSFGRFHKIDPSVSMRRQDLPAAYSLNGAIYAAQVDWLIASKSFVSPETLGYLMSSRDIYRYR